MSEIKYRNRRAVQIENDKIRVTVLVEGGHIAEILHKQSGVNPLWTPPWNSIEPSGCDAGHPQKHPEYGHDSESKLLCGIMGHNLALDLFGGPSPEEAAAGITVHGEASVATYAIQTDGPSLTASTTAHAAQLGFVRKIHLDGTTVHITETVENLAALDRPIAWTQHVTLGPPFLSRGKTQFRAPGTKSKVFEAEFGDSRFKTGATFDWPMVPLKKGGTEDLRLYTSAQSSAGFTTQMMDPHRESAFFVAWSPESKVLFGYKWKRTDFPWLGIWEENHQRTNPPWNGKTMTRGMEFGASPMPETRRQMIDRGSMFGVPGLRWIPAKTKVTVNYSAMISTAGSIPEEI